MAAEDVGMPSLRMVVLPAKDWYRSRIDAKMSGDLAERHFEHAVDALTRPLASEEAKPKPKAKEAIAFSFKVTASSYDRALDAGMEYSAARIKFIFGEKGTSGDLSYGIRDEQFALVSKSGKQYERPSIMPPKPELSGRLYPGDSLEGWLVLLVSIDDKKPLMSYGNNYNRVWLKLY